MKNIEIKNVVPDDMLLRWYRTEEYDYFGMSDNKTGEYLSSRLEQDCFC